MTMKQWYTAAELAGMPGLPVTPSGIVRRARIDGWETRRRPFGKGLEYRIIAVPAATLRALLAGDGHA